MDEASKQSSLTEFEKREIAESLAETEGSYVKGKVVCLDNYKFGIDDFPQNKDDIPYHLAIALDD